MLTCKDQKCRVEANNRLTWLLQTTLNKIIDLPIDIFVIEFNGFNEKLEEPVGKYSVRHLYIYLYIYTFIIIIIYLLL